MFSRLEVLVQSLPVIHFSVDQFENALLDVLKATVVQTIGCVN